MTVLELNRTQQTLLNRVFGRAYYSAAGYLFESRPFVVDADASLLDDLQAVRLDDRRHATLLASLLEHYDQVPDAGVFAWWYRDLNYLTVPTMTAFVVEALQDDLAVVAEALAAFPRDHRLAHVTLRTVRQDKERRLAILLPLAAEAAEREAKAYRDAALAVRKDREARLAKEKAAKAGAKGGARPAARVSYADVKVDEAAAIAGLPDPQEAGLSMQDRARRKIARLAAIRAAKRKAAGVGAPAAAVRKVDPATVVVDEAAVVAALPDPFEAGTSMEERARRKVARLAAIRAARRAEAERLSRAPQAGAAPGAAADTLSAQELGVADPDEAGITPKERAKRQILLNKARKAAAAAAPPVVAAAAEPDYSPAALGVEDPDEPGLAPKEKARRKVLYTKARKASEGAAGPPRADSP